MNGTLARFICKLPGDGRRPKHAAAILIKKFNVNFNTLRTEAFKLFKCMFLGSKQFKSTFILCFFKNL